VVDDDGQASAFSDAAAFEMLLSRKDWGGVWIGGGDLFRNHIVIKEKIKRARAYVCVWGGMN